MTSNDLASQLREQAPLVDRGYADTLMRQGADEIERLTCELAAAQASANDFYAGQHRLRAALERIAACDPDIDDSQLAKEALAGSPVETAGCSLHGETSCLRWYSRSGIGAHPTTHDALRWAREAPEGLRCDCNTCEAFRRSHKTKPPQRCGWFGEGRGQCLLNDGHEHHQQTKHHVCEEDGRLLARARIGLPLSDAQCDAVIAFLDDYEWSGLTRDDVRTWDQAIADARRAQETNGEQSLPSGTAPSGEAPQDKPRPDTSLTRLKLSGPWYDGAGPWDRAVLETEDGAWVFATINRAMPGWQELAEKIAKFTQNSEGSQK